MKNTRKRYAKGAMIQPLPSKRVIGNTTMDSGVPDTTPINYTPSSRYVDNSSINTPVEKQTLTTPTLTNNNPENIDNYSGDIANTLNLANNLYNTSKLQTTFKPKYITPPTRVYSSATPLGLYNNAVGARTAIKAMNRYNPNASNKFGVVSSQLDANNQLINQENQNRTGFNNQVAQDRYASSVYNTELDNKLAEMKVTNENAKLANKVNAVNAFSEGQMQNQQYRDRLKLDKEVAKLNAAGFETGNFAEYLTTSEKDLATAYKKETNPQEKARMKKAAIKNKYDLSNFAMGGRINTRKRYY